MLSALLLTRCCYLVPTTLLVSELVQNLSSSYPLTRQFVHHASYQLVCFLSSTPSELSLYIGVLMSAYGVVVSGVL